MAVSLPTQAKKYFWGDDLSQLNWQDHRQYIVQTLLNKADIPTLSWLFNQIDKQKLKDLLPELQLDLKSRRFWEVYVS